MWTDIPTCAMLLYAEYRGEWHQRKHSWRWVSQADALYEMDVTPVEPQHTALADAQNCRALMQAVVSKQSKATATADLPF